MRSGTQPSTSLRSSLYHRPYRRVTYCLTRQLQNARSCTHMQTQSLEKYEGRLLHPPPPSFKQSNPPSSPSTLQVIQMCLVVVLRLYVTMSISSVSEEKPLPVRTMFGKNTPSLNHVWFGQNLSNRQVSKTFPDAFLEHVRHPWPIL